MQISWDDAFDNIAKALMAIATRYSGEAGTKLLLAQGYQPEMIEEMGGAGTRTIKMRGGMGLLGVLGKYGMYRLNNSLALLDVKIRGVEARRRRRPAASCPTTPGTATRRPAIRGCTACRTRSATSTICASPS